jgi:hypothetical protein
MWSDSTMEGGDSPQASVVSPTQGYRTPSGGDHSPQVAKPSASGVAALQPRNTKGFECGCFVIQNKTSAQPFDVNLVRQIENVNRIWSVDFSGDGEMIAIAYSKAVQIFSIQTGNVIASVVVEKDPEFWEDEYCVRDPDVITHICLSGDGVVLIVGCRNGRIEMCDIRGQVKRKVDQRDRLEGLAVSADGRYAASSAEGAVWVWDVHRGSNYSKIKWNPGRPYGMAISPNGGVIAVYGWQHVHVYDTKTTTRIAQLLKPETEHFAAWNHVSFAGTRIICATGDGLVVKWDYTIDCDGDERTVSEMDSSNMSVRLPKAADDSQREWNLDCEVLMTSSWSNNIQFWNVITGEPCFVICDPDITWASWRTISLVIFQLTSAANDVHFAGNATCRAGLFASWSSHSTVRIWGYRAC